MIAHTSKQSHSNISCQISSLNNFTSITPKISPTSCHAHPVFHSCNQELPNPIRPTETSVLFPFYHPYWPAIMSRLHQAPRDPSSRNHGFCPSLILIDCNIDLKIDPEPAQIFEIPSHLHSTPPPVLINIPSPSFAFHKSFPLSQKQNREALPDPLLFEAPYSDKSQ